MVEIVFGEQLTPINVRNKVNGQRRLLKSGNFGPEG